MKNIFQQFAGTVEMAKNKAISAKKRQEAFFSFNKFEFIKRLFFTQKEIRMDEKNGGKINQRVYKWFEEDIEPEIDWIKLAKNINKTVDKTCEDDNELLEILDECFVEKETEYYLTAYLDLDCFIREWTKLLIKTINLSFVQQDNELGSIIAIFFIHGFKSRKLKENFPCCIQTKYYISRPDLERKLQQYISLNTEFEKERGNNPKINSGNNNIIYVAGPAYSGKTTLLLRYAKNHSICTAYCDSAGSYEEVLKQISTEEDAYIDYMKKKQLNYPEIAHDIKSTEERINKFTKPFWLILDHYKGDFLDCEELHNLKNATVFIETVRNVCPPLKNETILHVNPLNDEEIQSLFYLFREKYKSNNVAIQQDDNTNAILENVQMSIYNNPGLMILIAEYYWGMQAGRKLTKNEADKFLSDVARFHAEGKKDESIKGHNYYSITHTDQENNQKQHNILGHVRHLFENFVPDIEKNVFYVLALISSIEIETAYIKKWFGISDNLLEELEAKGWCIIDSDSMKIGIPQLIIHALKKDVFKSAQEITPFKTYIQTMTETIMRKAVKPVDVGIMQKIMLVLHNELLYKVHEYPSKVDNSVCTFHFACIKYFLDYGNSVDVKQMMDETFQYEEVKYCEGSSFYYDMLTKIQSYMNKNDISPIIDDILSYANKENVYDTEFSIRAVFNLMELYAKYILVESGTVLNNQSIDNIKLLKEFSLFQSTQALFIYVSKIFQGRKMDQLLKEELCFNCELYETVFMHMSILCNNIFQMRLNPNLLFSNFDLVCSYLDTNTCQMLQSENSLSILFDKICPDKKFIADKEKELFIKSCFLSIYAQHYMNTFIWYNRIDETAKTIIEDRWKKVRNLKSEIGELPISCADIYNAANEWASYILNKKELSEIDRYDYKHVKTEDPAFASKLNQLIDKHNQTMKKYE